MPFQAFARKAQTTPEQKKSNVSLTPNPSPRRGELKKKIINVLTKSSEPWLPLLGEGGGWGFFVFSSGWVEISQEIDGVAGGFYLGACTQGKTENKVYCLLFTVYGLPFQVLMLRIEPATPWQSPNKLGLCAWLKRSLQVMWFPLTSYIIHLTSLGCFLARRAGFFFWLGWNLTRDWWCGWGLLSGCLHTRKNRE